MSDSDSESENETLRRSRRSMVVKLEIRDSTSSSTSDDAEDVSSDSNGEDNNGSPVTLRRPTKRLKRLLTTTEDESTDSEPAIPKSRGGKNKSAKPLVYQDDDSEESDSSWSPTSEPVPSTSSASMSSSRRVRPTTSTSNDDPMPSTSSAASFAPALDEAMASSSETSSNDDESERCPICLHSFRDQPIGSPDTCDHTYCATCIEEWSRNVQTCPIDRLQFTSITVRDRFENGKFLRRIQVEASNTELTVDDDDLTHCEVCRNTNREDQMLLCDGCNRGYHMDCLSPPLNEIPESSWYCDYCFASDSSNDEEEVNQLIAEMEVVGVPETRLRVRRVGDTPRITRTRQSERIRATILSRIAPSRRHAPVDSTVSALGMPLPGSSSQISRYTRTSTRTRTSTTTTTSKRSSRKRRVRKSTRRSRRRTYVVEYDCGGDNSTSKFPLISKKKIVKRKSKAKKKKTKSRRCTNRTTRSANTSRDDSATATVTATSTSTSNVFPTLHLFGDPNALEYFSDEEHEARDLSDENAGRGLGGNDGGALLTADLTRARIGGTSSLRRRKRIISALDTSAATVESINVLSNIMETMDRWHEITKPDKVKDLKIDRDGKLVGEIGKKVTPIKETPKKGPDADIISAPMYSRGRGGGGGGGGGYNNNHNNNSNNSNNNYGNGNGGNNTNSATTSTPTGSGMSFSIFGPRNTSAPTTPLSGGLGANNNSFNDFSTPPFQQNPQNRRNQQQQNNFRPNPFNNTPQRFQNRNFGNNSFGNNNNINNHSQQQQQQPHQPPPGLYDDPTMPSPMMNPPPNINSLQMQGPPPQIALQNMHMNTPPPPFAAPAHAIIPPMMGIPPPNFMPFVANPPPMINPVTMPPPIAPIPIPTNVSDSNLYDPTVDSEEPDDEEPDATPDLELDIPLPSTPLPVATPAKASVGNKPVALTGLAANYGSDDDGGDDDDDDEDDEDDCPNFSIYSTASMNVARDLENPPMIGPMNRPDATPEQKPENDAFLENDEDLVQMDDDDDDEGEDEEEAEEEEDEESQTPVDEEKDKSMAAKKNVLDLHDDSDWEELNNDKVGENDGAKSDGEKEDEPKYDDRSYTPCLDEQVIGASDKSGDVDEAENKSDDEENDDDEVNKSGIAGMETELISDDESEDILNGKSPADRTAARSNRDRPGKGSRRTGDSRKDTDDPKKRNDKDHKGRDKKSDKDDSFKKISRSNKDRNYRDKKYDKRKKRRTRSRSLSRSRSCSNNKENRGRMYKRDSFRRRDTKRKDMERYDVRNVIADRQPRSYKDKYGRDTSRPRSRSVNRRRRSKSRSLSPHKRRSKSRQPRRSPSPRLRRRSPIRRTSYSPVNRKHRSRSPPVVIRERSLSRSRPFANGKSTNQLANQQQSRSPTPRQTRISLSPSPTARSREKIRSKLPKRKGKKRKISPDAAVIHHAGKKQSNHSDRVHISASRSWDRGEKQAEWNTEDRLSPFSRSPTPTLQDDSWTPPQTTTTSAQHLTVILKNKEGKRKKEKKQRKAEKRKESTAREKRDRRKRDKHGNTNAAGSSGSNQIAAPSKEVFASGDNILVSVSFNKDAANKNPPQTTIVTLPPSKDQIISKKQSETTQQPTSRRNKRNAGASARKHKKVDMKPVAIIDLDRSPFKEMTPSPKAVIILTDSEHEDDEDSVCKISQPNIIDIHHSDVIDHTEGHNVEQASQPQSPTLEDFDMANSASGPKTPPEPQLVKFSLPLKSKNKLRNVNNPLHDAIEEEQQQQLLQQQQQQQQQQQHIIIQQQSSQLSQPIDNPTNVEPSGDTSNTNVVQPSNKVGPNTPPESGPCSPDAYDPFEPTKSASASPDHTNDHQRHSSADEDDDRHMESHTPDLPPLTSDVEKIQQHQQQQQQQSLLNSDKQVKPVDLAMALINSKASLDAANSFLSTSLEGGVDASDHPSIHCIDDDDDDDEDDVQIISSTKDKPMMNNMLSHTNKDGRSGIGMLKQSDKPSVYLTKGAQKAILSSPLKQPFKMSGGSLISKLPLPKVTAKLPMPSTSSRHNGGGAQTAVVDNDENANALGHESPYSPDSSDYEDLFEPPTATPQHTRNKAKLYDELFGTIPSPNTRKQKQRQARRQGPVKGKPSSSSNNNHQSKLTEDQLRLFDEIPNSAVDLQYLQKLNRQERVVEEVKLVLKPHYYKKYITKDDYKDILRRSVPKICHNRTGEINPKKIKNLVEAYVRKFRQRRKLIAAGIDPDKLIANA